MSASIFRQQFVVCKGSVSVSILAPRPLIAANADTAQTSYGGPFPLVDHTGNTVSDGEQLALEREPTDLGR